MSLLNEYLDEYAESHQNQLNIKIHNICVPAIMWSLLGLLFCFHLAEAIALAALLFYLIRFKNMRIVAAMAMLSGLMLYSFGFVPELLKVSGVVFIVSWIGQFYGHKVEGKKPSFLKDLQFLLIGPVWVIYKLAPKFFGKN